MPFWAYMLHCRGGAFYTGQTDDLEFRVAQHHAGKGAAFTAERLPVELVWSQEFGTRDEAKEAEAKDAEAKEAEAKEAEAKARNKGGRRKGGRRKRRGN